MISFSMKSVALHLMTAGVSVFAALPSSTNYQLHNYNYGSGGTTSSSTNYSLNSTTGQPSNVESTSTNFKSRPGNQNTQQAYVPIAPTFTNPANYYNKLRFEINPGTNPSDTKFSIAISDDNFVTTKYIKNDNTVGLTRAITDYQTYATWGGASGALVVGLTPSTTYKIKVNAFQGKFTETEYGPTASAATVAPSITFDIDVSAIDTETAPPYTTSFGNLLPATVKDANEKIWIDVDTNANSGAMVYVKSANAGLKSNYTGVTIASASADLSSASTGYGVQGSTATQSSGGPLSISAPYNVAAQNVGFVDTALRQVFSATAPITAGRGSFILKARSAANTPSGSDYQDVLTIIAAGSY
jgi:hypothetical protein